MILSEAAKSLEVSTRTLRRWIQEGCPHEKNGRRYELDVTAVARWSADRSKGDGMKPAVDDLARQLQKARVEKTQAEAELTSMRRDVEAGKLVSAEDLRGLERRRIAVVRDGLLSLPTRLPPRLEGLDRVAMNAVIREEVHRLLNAYSVNRVCDE